MTVIKASFNDEKKPIDKELLIDNVYVAEDVEATGGVEEQNQIDPDLLMRVRAKRASAITKLVLILLFSLVFTISICGAFYIYKQILVSRMNRYKTAFLVPYYEEGDDQAALADHMIQDRVNDYNNNINSNNDNISPDDYFDRKQNQYYIQNVFDTLKNILNNKDVEEDMVNPITNGKSFREEFELDLNTDTFEKMHVPEFAKGRASTFFHDFNANITGILDIGQKRCFIMVLNRTAVLPPSSMLDLINKMYSGYYVLDTAQIRESYRASEIPMKANAELMGAHIANECRDYPVYQLEKIVSGVFKRSIDESNDNKAFTVLDGHQPRVINIVNIDSLASSNNQEISN